MIISASRRTDIPAFYSEWFIKRLKKGLVYVKNPRNPKRIASVALNTDVVDCIVFWTKNARPMLSKLNTIDAMGYHYYFQFTVTPYDKLVEKGLPPKSEIMETFKYLSNSIGKHRVVWRYDPIIVSHEFSVRYHLDAFCNMCDRLSNYTDKCVISFIDLYAKIRGSMKGIAASEVSAMHMDQIAEGFSKIAKSHKLILSTCSEIIDYSSYGINQTACIDQTIIENVIGYTICAKKDPNQRPACQCIESIDIGAYDSCQHNCVYCYATTSKSTRYKNVKLHDPRSLMLVGYPHGDEIITMREAKSLKLLQASLF